MTFGGTWAKNLPVHQAFLLRLAQLLSEHFLRDRWDAPAQLAKAHFAFL